MADNYGLKYTVPRVSFLLDADTADIDEGDALTFTDATSGYVKKVDAAAEAVMGFAMQKVDSPSSDGGASVLVDTSKESVYEFPADAGSVTQALVGASLDIGADGRSIDINGTVTADLVVVGVDTDANTCLIKRA